MLETEVVNFVGTANKGGGGTVRAVMEIANFVSASVVNYCTPLDPGAAVQDQTGCVLTTRAQTKPVTTTLVAATVTRDAAAQAPQGSRKPTPYPAQRVGTFSTYPGYTGALAPVVKRVWCAYTPGGGIRVVYSMQMKELLASGGIHMHAGTSCETAAGVGGHYYDSAIAPVDPWGNRTKWFSDSEGLASGTFDVTTGYAADDSLGHVMVVHAGDGTRVACGVLETVSTGVTDVDIRSASAPFPAHKSTTFAAYPGYTGTLTPDVKGAWCAYTPGERIEVFYNMQMKELSAGGGIHVHAGTSCETAADVGGHYYNSAVAPVDPWGTLTQWYSDSEGLASGSFAVSTGYTESDSLGHVMVVHASDGTRVACGVLETVPGGMSDDDLRSAYAPYPAHKPPTFSAYPGYTGALTPDIKGIWCAVRPGGVIQVAYNMQMKEKGTVGGIHMHAGTSCDTADGVGGHHWDAAVVPADPWDESYAAWSSDSAGYASGSCTITTGYADGDVAGRALVVHASDGTRIACGVLAKIPGGMLDGGLAATAAPYPTHQVASFVPYPGYAGSLTTDLRGVRCAYLSGGTMRVVYNVVMKEVSTSGGIHIHVGTSCNAAPGVGGHYYDTTKMPEDPWGDQTKWYSDETGVAAGSFTVATGYTEDATLGHVMVVLASDGARIACGVLENVPGGYSSYSDLLNVAAPYPAHKVAALGAYPGYTGDSTLELHNLFFAYLPDGTTSVSYNIAVGASEASASGGLHVHSGMSCADSGTVGGHYYDDSWRADPWGTTWASDATGGAAGSFVIDTGYGASENLGHAVVVHASDGTRIACGVLVDVAGGMSDADMVSAKSSDPFVERGAATTVETDTDAASGGDDGNDLAWLWVCIVLLILCGIGIGVWFLFIRETDATEFGEKGVDEAAAGFSNPAYEDPGQDGGYLDVEASK